MIASKKLALFTLCSALLASSCSEGVNSPEKQASDNKTSAIASAKSEPTPQKPEAAEAAEAAQETGPCTEVFLTGTGGGPATQFGNAQSGVFIRSGTFENGCNSTRLQFDAGRGTLMKLSLVPSPTRPGFVTPPSLSALFLTHGHSDHTVSVPDILETRWVMTKNDGQFPDLKPPKPVYKPFPVVCFDETCEIVEKALVPWDGEIKSRAKKDSRTSMPAADIRQFKATNETAVVWDANGVKVSAVSVDHIEGSVGYLIETAAGNICVSGDTSYSQNFKNMCGSADLIIHEVIHPVLENMADNIPNPDPTFSKVIKNIYNSHTPTSEFKNFSESESVVVLTHIIPALGAGGFQGIPLVPHLNKLDPERKTGPIRSSDFCSAIRKSGYDGELHVGRDLMHMKLSGGKVTTSGPHPKPTNCSEILTK